MFALYLYTVLTLTSEPCHVYIEDIRECSSSVCLTRDRGVAGLSLPGVTGLCPLARHINPCLVLVQPRKTCPETTENCLTGT